MEQGAGPTDGSEAGSAAYGASDGGIQYPVRQWTLMVTEARQGDNKTLWSLKAGGYYIASYYTEADESPTPAQALLHLLDLLTSEGRRLA